ncbi:MinD/ParA family protein [Haliovirga abyssi]|uniref:Site-determining protein n=1 Tax=Haliovirga abyssi TaxID=2996794 RepID=A0AAU9D9X8_9FUSO|nr:MinD/ParA family protein [Haliovirga abyssi]BDU50125.1 site-determining protein [Haliovirga abyssi]
MDQAEKLRELVRNKEKNVGDKLQYKNAKVFAITSGKGGVGKTSLAVNVAAFLSKIGKKVLIIDADLGLSNVEIMLGITPNHTIRDLIKNNKDIKEVITKGPFNLDFISGGNGFLEMAELSDVEREEILIKLQKLDEEYDVILIDTGAGISKNVISFLMVADEIIVITTSEPTSITDAYSVIKIVKDKIEKPDLGIIINRVKNIIEYKKASSLLINTSKDFLEMNIKNIGFIYEDSCVRNTIFKKTPFVIYYPDSQATGCIKYIVEKLEFNYEEKTSGLITKFRSWFKNVGR